ncbi:MAG: PilZ domain-containing protein [Candidatus Omnitrophica bacterium]|nr:PilZ domain-containing protein [Candidatus Omnitrophota bacterium]
MEDLESKLVQEKLVGPLELVAAKQEATRFGKSIWSAFVKLGYLNEEEITLFFSNICGIPYLNVIDYHIKPEVLRYLDEQFCRQNIIIPVFKVKNTLFIAFSNPLNTGLVDDLSKRCGCDIEPLAASANSIIEALNYYYGPEDSDSDLRRFIIEQSALRGLAFWRESERLRLEIPVLVSVTDKDLTMRHTVPIEGKTLNISRNGSAIGIVAPLFLPKGLSVSLEFDPQADSSFKVNGEIVHAHMEKGMRFFLGIKFADISSNSLAQLLSIAESHK